MSFPRFETPPVLGLPFPLVLQLLSFSLRLFPPAAVAATVPPLIILISSPS